MLNEAANAHAAPDSDRTLVQYHFRPYACPRVHYPAEARFSLFEDDVLMQTPALVIYKGGTLCDGNAQVVQYRLAPAERRHLLSSSIE